MSTAKRKQISLLDKLEIISDVDSGQKQTTVAEKFGLSRKTVNTIMKNREAILKQQEDGGLSAKRIRLRGASYPKVEEALLLWLRDALAKNIPVNGVLLRKRAEQLAFLLDCADFKCSEGWLDRFKARNGISFKCISGESDSVDLNCVSSWKDSKLPQLLHGYSPDDVFNADESGLFYKLRPGKTVIQVRCVPQWETVQRAGERSILLQHVGNGEGASPRDREVETTPLFQSLASHSRHIRIQPECMDDVQHFQFLAVKI